MIIKIINHFRNNIGKLKDFLINSISGLFTGIAIGLLFKWTTDTEFNRWIDFTSLELVAAIVYVIFILILLLIFYGLGMLMTFLVDKKKRMSFHLNFVSGTYCSIMSFTFVLYSDIARIRNSIAVIGFLTWLIIAGFTINKKWPK
jgi:hypothetical protein